MTIARGHLEVLRATGPPEIDVALDELARIEQILERLLLLAKADESDFVVDAEIDLDVFLEDLFLRWSEVSPRVWRLGGRDVGTLRADPDALRIALDALLENAVEYTKRGEAIEVRAVRRGGDVVIEIEDGGRGMPRMRSTRSSTGSPGPTRDADEHMAASGSGSRSSTQS